MRTHTRLLSSLLLALSCCTTASAAAPLARPDDIIELHDIAPDIAEDIRYHGSNNFIGRPIAGYRAAKCLLTRPAAVALAKVQQELRPFGYSLKVYDCYRPQQAVDDFVAWATDLSDQRMKARFYPQVEKQRLFKDGYIAARSSHSRASTVDLTIIPLPAAAQPDFDPDAPLHSCEAFQTQRYADNSLDMGTGYDCFSPLSATDHPDIGLRSHSNRQLLKTLMQQHGYTNLPGEWWHYTLKDEPYPNTCFKFPVQ